MTFAKHILTWALLISAGLPGFCQMVRIHTQDEMNPEQHELNSHAGVEKYSSLEPIWRYNKLLETSSLIPSNFPEEQNKPFYPRIKALPDGSYIMFYQGGQVASRVLSCFSDDLIHWSTPQVIMGPKKAEIDGVKTYMRYTTIDACVLDNGTLLFVASFRNDDFYRKGGKGCGIVAARSHDNGRTWTRSNVIYEGTNWEPYAMQLPDGTVQVYFTDNTVETRNSGTSLIESRNGGVDFGPKKRVMRQYKYFDKGERIYTDQMPCVRLLNDGKTLMAAVEARLEMEGPDGGSSYWISIIHNDGTSWQNLGEDSEGPKKRMKNVLNSNAPYLVTLPSGEVLLSTGYQGLHSVKIADHTGMQFNHRRWETDWLQPCPLKGVWGSIEASGDKHHIIHSMDTGNGGKGIQLAVSYLNHRIDAPAQNTVLDGDGAEWNGGEALFIGSDGPAETIFRASHDSDNLYILAERADEAVNDASKIKLSLCNAASPKMKPGSGLSLLLGPQGAEGKVTEGVKACVRGGKTIKGTPGYVAEIAIPLQLLGSGSEFCFNATVLGDGKLADGFWNAKESSPDTWQRIRLSDRQIPALFKASHTGEEQWSVLQPMPAFQYTVPNENLLIGLPETADEQKFACYPRIKKMADGRWLMLYMGGRFGSRIWATTSDDFLNWSEPEMLYKPYSVVMPDGEKDVVRFVNGDAVVLQHNKEGHNGDIIMVCSFRAASHYNKGEGCGLSIRRSSDNGKTWSEAQQIYDQANWEPYILELPDGRLQCFFTDARPAIWSSGTAMLESFDGGFSWGEKKLVSRQWKYDYRGHAIFTDQMPCFRLLADGKTIAGWLEARLETKIPLDYKDKKYYASYCKASMVYNDGFDWVSLPENGTGPARRFTNVRKAAGGYMVVFPSGEVVISHNHKNSFMMKVLDTYAQPPLGQTWTSDELAAFPESGYWGCMELDGRQSLVASMHGPDGLQMGKFWLNHRISASAGGWSEDALYLGIKGGGDMYLRSKLSDGKLLLDVKEGEGCSVKLRLCVPGGNIVEKNVSGDGEVSIGLDELGAQSGDYICIFAELRKAAFRARFTNSIYSDPQTWQRIRIE